MITSLVGLLVHLSVNDLEAEWGRESLESHIGLDTLQRNYTSSSV